jgi:hypothetical protein
MWMMYNFNVSNKQDLISKSYDLSCAAHSCRHGVRSLRYNSMQNASEWDGRLKHALGSPLSEEGHVLRPSLKEHKKTIGNPKEF